MADDTRIEILKTPFATPTANDICARFIGSVWRECLDHLLILVDRHLLRAMKEYIEYYHRPHQGLAQHIPAEPEKLPVSTTLGRIAGKAVLGGLHHH